MHCWHFDFSLHVPLPASGPGIEAISNGITTCRASFHGLNVTINDMTADGDGVTGGFPARGEHRAEFMGLPPAGKPIVMTGIKIFRPDYRKFAELRGEPDLPGLMRQMGILPSGV